MKFKKLLFIIISGVLTSITAKSQSNNIYCSYWNGNMEVFTSMDMTNGVFTDIGTLNGVQTLYSGESTFDPNNGHYYRLTNLGITVVNIQTGTIVNTYSNPKNVKGIEYDPISSKLYGSYWNGNTEVFTSMDITSGVFTDIGTLNGVQIVYSGESTFDPYNGYYFRLTNLGLIVVDIQTGTIVNTYSNPKNVKGIEYDPFSSILYGSYWNGNKEVLTSMDMTNGVFTDIGTLNGVQISYSGESTFDPDNAYYFRLTNLGLTVVDIQTGTIINTISNTINLKGIEFNFTLPHLNIIENNFKNELYIYPNPTKDIINIVLKNNDETQIAIFDYTGKLMYSKVVNKKKVSIDLRSYTSGIYIVKLDTNEKIITKKFIKN